MQRDHEHTTCTVELFWCNERPSEVVITIRKAREVKTWHVARSSFIAANLPFYRGAWAGAGSFSVKADDATYLLAFKPSWVAPVRYAFVKLDAEPVRDYIEHTCRIVPPGAPEEEANLANVDRALQVIFGE
jgi:hypothetical protein